jgi:lipopolysaccharide/colanic/teichoic acid biosynthesis glycosyltransferase
MNVHIKSLELLDPSVQAIPAIRRSKQSLIGWGAGRIAALKPVTEYLITLTTFPLWGALVLVLWLAIKCTDPRHPAFFYQLRTGRYGRRFRLIKLRTMVPNAARMQSSLAAFNMSKDMPVDFKMANDPRVTKLGRFLRKTHLDELPQLINVLIGDMAIVGPRPCSVPVFQYHETWLARLTVRPGLTGLAQISRADTPSFEDRVRLDIEYIQKQSLWLDIWIVWRTFIVALIRRKGI